MRESEEEGTVRSTKALRQKYAGGLRFDPWMGKIPWRIAWQLTPVFLSGESHGQRSLVSYSPKGHKQLDMTDGLST